MIRHEYPLAFAIVVLSMFTPREPSHSTVACEQLREVRLRNTTITVAEVDSSRTANLGPGRGRGRGRGASAGGRGQPADSVLTLAPICRVRGRIAPTRTSDIVFEVWLPMEKWNGKFAGVGNSGWAGAINVGQMAVRASSGYAVAGTNTGHVGQGPDERADAAKFAFEQPEQLIDYAYRSVHEMTVVAKAIVEQFYGRPPAHSYWIGASTGGKQGLIEAQRYPGDYDGIVAVSPPIHFTTLKASYLHKLLVAAKDSASYLDDTSLRLLHNAVLAACDSLDGLTDRRLTDPRSCNFSPTSIQCSQSNSTVDCLAPAQVAAASGVYEGLKDPRTGVRIAHGMSRGSELNWGPEVDSINPNITYFRWLVFGDSTWDWRTFDFSRPSDMEAWLRSESKYAAMFNGTNPDLVEFESRGGKIVHWHGWNDQQIPALNSIDYYDSVMDAFPRGIPRAERVQRVQRFYRLFLGPGGGHGNAGVDVSPLLTALEQWVERGIAPERITAAVSDRGSRALQLLCPYPQVAIHSGKGDPAQAATYACDAPIRR